MIKSHQFNYIKAQAQTVVNGYTTVNDDEVLKAIKSMALERVQEVFPEASQEQMELFQQIEDIKNKEDVEVFLAKLVHFVLPFKKLTEQQIKKLFPKEKKLKLPDLSMFNLKETSYISWIDKGSNKKFIVCLLDDQLIGVQGSFSPLNKKGICTICNGYEEIGLFVVKKKGSSQDSFSSSGNYICTDSQSCNRNLQSLDKLNYFIQRHKK